MPTVPKSSLTKNFRWDKDEKNARKLGANLKSVDNIYFMLNQAPPSLPRSLSSFLPPGATPRFIQPAHGGNNYRHPDAPDIDIEQILPALPERDAARSASAWSEWKDWQLATALLPERDTVNGEYFEITDIAPCVGRCHPKSISRYAQQLYPDWCGRYRFRLVHVLRLVKCYQQNGVKKHSRAELIRMVAEKFYGAS